MARYLLYAYTTYISSICFSVHETLCLRDNGIIIHRIRFMKFHWVHIGFSAREVIKRCGTMTFRWWYLYILCIFPLSVFRSLYGFYLTHLGLELRVCVVKTVPISLVTHICGTNPFMNIFDMFVIKLGISIAFHQFKQKNIWLTEW